MKISLNQHIAPTTNSFQVDWHRSIHNIIFLSFNDNYKLINFLNELPARQRALYIVPQIKFGTSVIRSTRYKQEIKNEIKNIKMINQISKSVQSEIIYDLTPACPVFKQYILSRGALRGWEDMIEFIQSVYKGLKNQEQYQKVDGTTLILDLRDNPNLLKMLEMYLKNNKFIMPQISDYYILNPLEDGYMSFYFGPENNVFKPAFEKYKKIVSHENSETRITPEDLKEAVIGKLNKKITDQEAEYLVSLINSFVSKYPDIKLSAGDENSIIDVLEKALKYQDESIQNSNAKTFEELLLQKLQKMHYSKEVDPESMDKTNQGIKGLKVTGIKWYTSSERTKDEFTKLLTKQMKQVIESLNDGDFGFKILGVTSEIEDDGKSRYVNFKIKVKPDKGRSYTVNLRIPALVHGTYFKIGGNYYVINNQLMQKPIIKKADNVVQLKTNYSVINYSIKNSSIETKTARGLIEYFINLAKSKRLLQKAEVMDKNTEEILKSFKVPSEIISNLWYKKIYLK